MKNIANLLVQNNIVKFNFETPFLWTSGIKSPIYCDCRELIALPELRQPVVQAFIDSITKNFASAGTGLNTVDFFAGTATAGIPWAAFVAQKLEKSMLYVRSRPKGHGAGKMVEGRGAKNSVGVVVEDAISTAGSSVKSVEALRRELTADVQHIFAIFSWDTDFSHKNAAEAQVQLHPLTTFAEIIEAAYAAQKISLQQKQSLESFRANPAGWSE
jgi:orotate phosphoribosyltransferase